MKLFRPEEEGRALEAFPCGDAFDEGYLLQSSVREILLGE
jgi:hypothetical protein